MMVLLTKFCKYYTTYMQSIFGTHGSDIYVQVGTTYIQFSGKLSSNNVCMSGDFVHPFEKNLQKAGKNLIDNKKKFILTTLFELVSSKH